MSSLANLIVMTTYTLIQVLSLAGILSGFAVLFGLLNSKALEGWTAFFLGTATVTSITGFFFPFHAATPALGADLLSLLMLAIAVYARYLRRLAGGWCRTYLIAAMVVLYLNVFGLIVQAFQNVPALKELAPKRTEPPFVFTQLAVLIPFIELSILAAIRFRHEPPPTVSEIKL